jgi:photosystem II stability/assembly factor-like uncharacterized protein
MTPTFTRFAATLLLVPALASLTGAAEEYAIYKSADRGRSWFRSDTGISRASRINAFGALDDSVLVGTDSGIFVSEDEGKHWEPASGAAASSGRVISFAALKSKVFAGTDGNGIVVSSDKGKSWFLDAAFPSKKVRCLLAHEGKLYAGTDAEGAFASEDGQVWTQLSRGFPADGQAFALAMVKDTLFAGLYSKGLYAWDLRESHWAKAGAVLPLALAATGDTLVAGHNPGGLYWSADLGSTWSRGTASAAVEIGLAIPDEAGGLSNQAPVWELASGDELVLGGVSAGIYYSEDRGRTWTRARTGLPEQSPGIAFFLKRGFVLAGTRISGANGEPGGGATRKDPSDSGRN